MTEKQLQAMSFKELLLSYKQKIHCYHSEYTTYRLNRRLGELMEREDYLRLNTAAQHLRMGEGSAELDTLCAELI